MPYYEDRNRERIRRNTILGGFGILGIASLFSSKNIRQSLGRNLTKGLYDLSAGIESRLYNGVLKDVSEGIASKSSAGRVLNFSNSTLGRKFISFDRFVGIDLLRQTRRDVGINYLTEQAGWSLDHAKSIFRDTGKSYDILTKLDVNEVLAHPLYREHILSNIPYDKQKVFEDLSGALFAAREVRTHSSEAFREANRLFALHLEEQATRRNFLSKGLGAFGLKQATLKDITNSNLFEALDRSFGLGTNIEAPMSSQEQFIQNVGNILKKKNLTEAEKLAARSAYSLKLAGNEGWRSIVEKLPTDILLSEDVAINTRPIFNLFKAGFDDLSNNFQIPIAPGLRGMMPLKLMPWSRGLSKDFAGTLGAGTGQREIYEALKNTGIGISFDKAGKLDRDLYFIGNRLFGTDSEENVISLPEKINNWKLRNANYGFQSEFAKNRVNQFSEQPIGSVRKWFGDSFIGKGLDKLGLDKQSEPSRFSKYFSAFNKYVFGDSEKYYSHPMNALNRVLNRDSNEISDVEAIIRGVRRHTTIPKNIKPSQLFTKEVLDNLGLDKGLRKLVENDFKDEDLAEALREIDAIMGGSPVRNAKFFGKDYKSDFFKGLHTKINARRFAQNDIGTLTANLKKSPDPSIFNLEGLFGQPNSLTGFDRFKELFYEEVFHHTATSPNGSKAINDIINNIYGIGLGTEESRELGTHVWSLYQEKYLSVNFIKQAERAAEVAKIMRDPTTTVGQSLTEVIDKFHGGFTPWVNPNIEEIEGVGSYLYATPPIRSGFSGATKSIKEAIQNRDFEPIRSLFREVPKGYGNAVAPGPIYHSAFRLNQMLSEFGLGLPSQDTQTAGAIFGNIFLKRVLPIYAGVEAWKYLNFELNEDLDLSPAKGLANVRARVALTGSWLADKLGLTDKYKRISELTPGSEAYYEPKSYEEQKQYLRNGYEPSRRGRFWLAGSRSAYMGDKITHYSPSWYQLQTSDWQRASNVDLNSDDYWKNQSLLPTPRHPFSWLRRLLLDRYSWENKHSVGDNPDRPYVVSSELADPNTLVGNIINQTIGRFIKPQRILHPEYLPGGNKFPPQQPEQLPEDLYVRFTQSGQYDVIGGIDVGVGEGNGGSKKGLPSRLGIGGFKGRRFGKKIIGEPEEGYVPVGRIPQEETYGNTYINPLDPKLAAKNIQHQWYDIKGIYGFSERTVLEQLGVINPIIDPIIQSPTRATSWERRFYDKNLGGLLGDLNEWWRRMLPHRNRSLNEFNPVENSQPQWMPARFRRGDPYLINQGEVRIPGEAFERVRTPSYVPIRASSIGMSPEEIASRILGGNIGTDTYATRFGDKYHKIIQDQWKKMGVLESKELKVIDAESGISGHFDAILNLGNRRLVGEIKTMGNKKFEMADQPFSEHVAQLNLYLHATGIDTGSLYYINRDDPTQVKSFEIGYNDRLYRESKDKAREAINIVNQRLKEQGVGQGGLYDSVTRAEILSDIAPYSQELKVAMAQARNDIEKEHDPEYADYLQQRLNDARKRASKLKKLYNIHNYRFNQETETRNYTIKSIIDPNTFTVEETDTPIRLAGTRLSNERIKDYITENNIRIKEGEDTLTAFYRTFNIEAGSKIKAIIDPDNLTSKDLLRTQRATIFSDGVNINSKFLSNGVGLEKEGDDSGPGIVARYSRSERFFGNLWERFAHLETPWHSKFLPVRSSLEQYQRTQVYGTIAGDWSDAIRTYIRPTMDSIASKNPILATLGGALIGSFFGVSRKSKLIGAAIGGSLGLEMSGRRAIEERLTGETYIPERVQKRREIEEYYDTLKYIKYKKLENFYSKQALDSEGIDIQKVIEEQTIRGENYKRRSAGIEKKKREIILSDLDEETKKRRLSGLNWALDKITRENRVELKIGPNAAKALMYRGMSARTLQGSKPGDPIDNAVAGLPRYEKELALDIVTTGSSKEKKAFYKLLSKKQKSALGWTLGVSRSEIPKKESLEEYFRNHTLPDESWRGWSESADLNDFRTIAAREEGVVPIEMGIYPRNEADAEEHTKDIPVPTVSGRSHNIRETLHRILGGRLRDLRIDLEMTPADETSSEIDVHIQQNRENDITSKV